MLRSVNCLLKTKISLDIPPPPITTTILGSKHIVRFDSTTNQTLETSVDSERNIKSDVINLYKNLIYLSREWHTDLRPQIKQAFMKNKDVKDEKEIQELIKRGEYICREFTALYHLKKYRAMKNRYYGDEKEKQLDGLFKNYTN